MSDDGYEYRQSLKREEAECLIQISCAKAREEEYRKILVSVRMRLINATQQFERVDREPDHGGEVMGWLEEFKQLISGWDFLSCDRGMARLTIDRLIAIAKGAEWGSLNAASYEPICPLCRNIEREGHKTTCEYHEDWTP